ncbi:DUF2061 domain-containing protein [Roseovarius sp. TE539]|uniref:DUF2061 domain-containing protein n=1 Tax=Roseovarius sp. TE539 TaxID=2249812 RepID=UPI000DDFB3A1|nr:DUF2061 domain-containing protein [Roseovarius sp. TE539]RBI74560.1 DUF2061 domain-containing protein [Roseovarius sp. TE539]
METRKRTVVKAFLWNGIGLLVMGLVGLVMTGSALVGGTMALINTGIGLTTYVIYERVWARITWGRSHG